MSPNISRGAVAAESKWFLWAQFSFLLRPVGEAVTVQMSVATSHRPLQWGS